MMTLKYHVEYVCIDSSVLRTTKTPITADPGCYWVAVVVEWAKLPGCKIWGTFVSKSLSEVTDKGNALIAKLEQA